MNSWIQIEWAEMREVGGGHELFFVEATETASGWRIRERSTWESKWYSVPPALRLILIAEFGRAAVEGGRVYRDRVFYSMTVDRSHFSEFQIRDRVERPRWSSGNVGNLTTILARFRFGEFSCHSSQKLTMVAA